MPAYRRRNAPSFVAATARAAPRTLDRDINGRGGAEARAGRASPADAPRHHEQQQEPPDAHARCPPYRLACGPWDVRAPPLAPDVSPGPGRRGRRLTKPPRAVPPPPL